MADEEKTGQTESNSVPDENQEAPVEQEKPIIPEKFLGKSTEDVVKSYVELEKELGRLREELGTTKNMLNQFQAIDPYVRQYVVPQSSVPQEEVSDPYKILESRFEEDPKRAISDALRLQEQKLSAAQRQQMRQLQRNEMLKYYESQRTNPDFLRREALMQQLALKFKSLLNPEHIESPEAIQALDLMSRGLDLSYYENQAVERAKKDGLLMREEKKKAFSETASSEKSQEVDFSSLSLDEMRKRLGVKE